MRNVLSVRKEREIVAHEVLETVRDKGWIQDRDAPRLVILIHGYQTSEDKARRLFERFHEALRARATGGLGAVWEFHWPGDHEDKLLSVATYPDSVVKARVSGQLLAERWLAERQRSQSAVLVAHSLGCRVALETVKWILDHPDYDGARIEALFLLAAAVPVDLCSPEESFARKHRESSEHVFYSRRDRVLQFSFDPGQHGAGESGYAVGRYGEPIAGRWDTRKDTRLAHRRYWPSRAVAEGVVDLLGPLRWRPLDSRQLALFDLGDDERELERRRLGGRELAVR